MKIALHGKKRSGKDTLGDYLVDHYEFLSLGFADPLKTDLVSLGISADQLYDAKDPVFRTLMQVYGEAHRVVDEDYWINRLVDTVESLEHDFGDVDVVVTDLRYFNEAQKLQHQGYKLVKVVCTDDVHDDDHASEIDLDDWNDWDAVITANRGSISQLFDQMDTAVTRWECER